MNTSAIIDLIIDAYLDKWQNEIDNADDKNFLAQKIESKQLLRAKFTEEENKLIDKYVHSAELYFEDKFFQMSIKILNLGIKIGINVQEILSEE